MAGIDKIDYSAWTDARLRNLAESADKDDVKGLQGKEIIDFTKSAIENKIDKDDFFAQVGLHLSQKASSAKRAKSVGSNNSDPVFDAAVNYYNNKMSYFERSDVTYQTYNNLETRLYNMEKAIDTAMQDCDAYRDIVIVPRWHYRFYPYWDDRLINFDVDELRQVTTKDMASLHELKDKLEYIMEEANGIKTHTEPEKTEYDVDVLAQKYFGMSYEEFASKYKNELEFCKTVTYADLGSMNETQRMVYSKAKAYAKEMLNTTINEAHIVNWDIGERKTDETLKASGDMYLISDFEYDGITEDGLSQIQSGIMYKAFEDALISKYQELDPDGVEAVKGNKSNGVVKKVVNGAVLIFHPDGKVYDEAGRRIK